MLMLKHLIVRSAYLFLTSIFVFSSIGSTVNAKPIDTYKKLQWPFYEEGCSQDTTTSSATGKKIYLLGDSLLAGSFYANTFLADKLTGNGWQATADASVGRSLTTGGSDPTNNRPGHEQPGMDAVDTDSAIISDPNTSKIVIELGTNTSGSATQFEGQVKTLLSKIKAKNNSAKIYWVNIVSTSDPIYASYNNKLSSLADSQGYSLIDAKSKNIQLSPGNLHPTTQGYKDYSNAISDAVGKPADTSTAVSSGSSCCTSSESASSVSGSISPGVGKGMSASVKQKFQQIMVAAGQKFNVDPNFVATFYYIEDGLAGGDSTNNGNSAAPPPRTGDGNWLEPPPPYGHGPAYPPPNAFSATGPYQFIDSTWAAYGVDGNGDGKVDVRDLTDAAFAASKYLAASGAKGTTKDADLRKAAFSYNHSTTYGDSALNTFHYLTGKGSTDVSGSTAPSADCSAASGDTGTANSGKFTNPFPGGWIPNRLDMGYDGTFKGQIVAPFSGNITYTSNSFSNWGGWLEIKADSKPSGLPTSTLYFAEGIKPIVKSGHVNAGEAIATGAPSPYGDAYATNPSGIGEIEWGVALNGPNGSPTNAYVYGKCGSAGARASVLSFSRWAQQTLKVAPPSQTSNAGCP
jgi:hypothetical protein